MRTRVVALIVLLLAGLAPRADAKRPTPDEIRERLRSDSAIEVAWGLHQAIVYETPGVEEGVVAALVRAGDAMTPEAARLRSGAIDAAVLLRIPLPAPLVRTAVAHTGTTRALLLLARDPASFRDLLEPMLELDGEDDLWVAVCNLLVSQRSRALTLHLLGRLRIEAHLLVRDPDDDRYPFGNFGGVSIGGVACGTGTAVEEGAWPPRFTWELRTGEHPWDVIVAPGREPVSAHRFEVKPSEFFCVPTGSDWCRDWYAEAYLAEILGKDVDTFRRRISEYCDIPFRDAASYAVALEDVTEAMQRTWRHVVSACVRAGLVFPVDALGVARSVNVRVDDQRRVKSPPLPDWKLRE